MQLRDTENMSIEEREAYIQEINVELERLKPIVEANKRKEEQKYIDLGNLMAEHSKYKKMYYDNRLILGDALIEISDSDYAYLESTMPILEETIKLQEEKLKKFVDDNFTKSA